MSLSNISQKNLNAYFTDKVRAIPQKGEKKWLFIKDGTLHYDKVNALWRFLAYLGFGKASFKNVVAFCATHGVVHEKLPSTIDAYNEKRVIAFKKVDTAFKNTVSYLQDNPYIAMTKTAGSGTALMHAAASGDKQLVKLLLKCGVNVDEQDADGTTALMKACNAGAEEVVELLLRHGANPKLREKEGATALHYACEGGWDSIIRLLVKKGVDLEAKTKEGCTPLLELCAEEDVAEQDVAYLISKGANRFAKDNDGDGALHFAAAAGNEKLVQLLLDLGLKPDEKNTQGRTPLDRAKNEEIKKLLAEG